MSWSDREGQLPREGAGLTLCGKTEQLVTDEICNKNIQKKSPRKFRGDLLCVEM